MGAWPVSRFLNSGAVRLVSALLGIVLLTYLVWRTGPANLLENIRTLGWGLAVIVALGGVAHVVKTWAWQLTLLDEKRHVSFARLLGLRLASEAAGQLGLFGQAFGETLRVSLLNSTIPLACRITSVALDRALFIFSTMVVTIAGLLTLLLIAPLPARVALAAILVVLALLVSMIFLAFAVWKRWPVLSRIAGRWLKPGSVIQSVEHDLLGFWHRAPKIFWMSLALNISCQLLAILEVYLTLTLMGFHIGIAGALSIEALTKLINTLGGLTPGNVGLYEGGNMLIAKLFGFTAAAGLTVALTRRFRAIFWAIIGVFCVSVLSKSAKVASPKKDEQPLPAGHGHIAIIFANNAQGYARFGLPLPRVRALPVLLRAILGARKAGAARIVVALDHFSAPWLKSDLMNTGRVPDSVEWLDLMPGEAAMSSLFDRLADYQNNRIVIIDGDCIYHPSLYRLVTDWSGDGGGLTLSSGEQLVGLYALSPEVTAGVAMHLPPFVRNLSELHKWLRAQYPVTCETVEADKWQRALTPGDRIVAEQKLDRWIVKATDGRFARMNRKVSIPISRQLIKFPITPNMVSLFTLGVSFLAAVFFACGGYWNMLMGAILSLFASILDGCDGEVARLKCLESDFGCWLETACDYLYYLFIYAGMAIGLAWTLRNENYVILGALFFFGAITTFVISFMQRQRLTNGRPEQLLEIWQKKAESRPSNPLLYIGRRLEFMIRRCFLPYALLFFAALNIIKIAFILSVVGVNVAWPIVLYSYLKFAPQNGSRSLVSAVSPRAEDDEAKSHHVTTADRCDTANAALSVAE